MPFTPSRRTLTVLIVALSTMLAGCTLAPDESRGGDPDVGVDPVEDEKDLNEIVDGGQTLRTTVSVWRDTGNVEAVVTLSDQRVPDANESDLPDIEVLMVIVSPTGEVLREETVIVEDTEGEEVTFGVDMDEIDDSFWDEFPEDTASEVALEITPSDGPTRVIGHYRSFQ